MKLTSFRLYILFVVLCCALIAAAFGITRLSSKFLASQGETLTNAKLEHEVAQSRLTTLHIAQNNIAEYEELERIAKGVLPQEKDQVRTVREIIAIAQQHGVQVGTISFPDSKLGAKSGSSSSQMTAVKGISGLYVMEISVNSGRDVRYENFLAFVKALQENRRTANITSVSANPNDKNRNMVAFTLTINAYVRP